MAEISEFLQFYSEVKARVDGIRSRIAFFEDDLSVIQTQFDFLKTQIQKVSEETQVANTFIEGFTQEELTCSSLGDYWQRDVVGNICGNPEKGTGSLAQISANLLITLYISLLVQSLITVGGFLLTTKSYKQASSSYTFGSGAALTAGDVQGVDDDVKEDMETVDEAKDLDDDAEKELQENLIKDSSEVIDSESGKTSKPNGKAPNTYNYNI